MTISEPAHPDRAPHTLAERAEHDGYFLVEGLIPDGECSLFVERLQEFAATARALPEGLSLHREPMVETNGPQLPKGHDIRKIGGLIHDDLFRKLITRKEIIDRMRDIVGEPIRLFRADALMKPAQVGSEKGVHQDSPYWPIEPMSLWSCWIPFDDATLDNGCLMVVKGSHRKGPMPHVSTQNDYVIPTDRYDGDDLVAVPMKRGTGIFFHSLLIHGSAANTSGTPRRAVTMSYLGPHHRYVGTKQAPEYPTVS